MKKFHSNSMKALAFSASAIAFATAAPAFAQDAEPGEDCVTGTNAAGVIDADGNCVQTEDGPTGTTTGQGDQVEIATGASGQQSQQGGITVTGSRIVRDTYSSISPLQVLSTENQQAVGAFDPAQILQRSEAASGTQIDATFQGFVLDNGPGSQTINLRGLGAGRTLVLVNGRRLAPAGVEGAPTNPSINLIPASLVDRYDLLTDGASSVYGSDAVAGVVNVILRKDFDGLELQANGDINPDGAGEDYTLSAAWGFNTDRAVFGIGAEYQYRDEVKLRDRPFLNGCTTNLEEDANGNIYTLGLADNAVVSDRTPGVSVSESDCVVGGISGRIFQPFTRFGSVYFPANGNIANFPVDPLTGNTLNFGESTGFTGVDADFNGDGIRDVDFQNVNTNGSAAELDRTFISEQELINVFAYGEYTFPGDANLTPFFEAQYTRAEIFNSSAGNPQIFPSVPDLNPFNPCNLSTNPDGVDCRGSDNALQLLLDPLIFTPVAAGGSGLSPLGGVFNLPTIPIAAIRGDRNNFEVTQEQYRGVLGLRGDLPFIGSSWTFEVAGVYSRSEGTSARNGIREDRLALALGLDPTADYDGDGVVDNDGDGIADDYDNGLDVFGFFGDPQWIGVCNGGGLANPDLAAPDLNAAGCVPVNLFAASVLTGPVGDFATQAERDYVFDARTFDTTYEQILLSAYITGDLFELPAGPVGAVIGGEWREDKIESNPSLGASNGLFFGFFADGGASGSKNIREAFAEIDIPLMAGETLVEELTLNVSGRITDEEFYGTNGTFSIKGGWRPVSSLLLKMSYGTSFRAPNLRENFLRGQSGFGTLFDPCAVPDDAFVNGAYDASLDQRPAFVLQNCLRENRDPTSVGIDAEGLNTQQFVSGEITTGGTFDIDPETSRSITTGFAFEESFPSGFDFALNVNYFDIKLKDSIIEPTGQFIINDCYFRDDVDQRSEFCDRVQIGAGDRNLISGVLAGFLNRDEESVRGLDINTTFGYPLSIGDEVFDLQLNLVANHLIERSTLTIDEDGNGNFNSFEGEFGFPDWTGRITFNVDWKDFRLTWQTRYVDSVNNDFRDEVTVGDQTFERPFGDAFNTPAPGTDLDAFPNVFSPTCLGDGGPNGNVAGSGIFCRPIGTADEYFESSVSLRWDNGDYRVILGVANVFDEAPPQVSPRSGVLQISNTAIGNGYDLDGREFFAQLLARF